VLISLFSPGRKSRVFPETSSLCTKPRNLSTWLEDLAISSVISHLSERSHYLLGDTALVNGWTVSAQYLANPFPEGTEGLVPGSAPLALYHTVTFLNWIIEPRIASCRCLPSFALMESIPRSIYPEWSRRHL
jgi:hypothetical protein